MTDKARFFLFLCGAALFSFSSALAQKDVVTDRQLSERITALMTKAHNEKPFGFEGAVLVARNGHVILKEGYGLADRANNVSNTSKTRFRIASISKQFTALAILMLQEEGKLNVNDAVCDYVPDCPVSWQDFKIHHLLTHTTGLFLGMSALYDEQFPPKPSTPAQIVTRIKDYPPMGFTPGEGFYYSNDNYQVAGYIVERVSGQTYAAFLKERVFEPLNMKDSGYTYENDSLAIGYPDAVTPALSDGIDYSLAYAAGGVYSTVEDLYTYIEALKSGQLLSKTSLNAMLGHHIEAGGSRENPFYYGYGWVVASHNGLKVVGHSGGIPGYRAQLSFFPDDDVTVVVLQNVTQPIAEDINLQIIELIFAE